MAALKLAGSAHCAPPKSRKARPAEADRAFQVLQAHPMLSDLLRAVLIQDRFHLIF
jgi:hypothetical protein